MSIIYFSALANIAWKTKTIAVIAKDDNKSCYFDIILIYQTIKTAEVKAKPHRFYILILSSYFDSTMIVDIIRTVDY